MEETISLQEIFSIIRKRIALIFTCLFMGLGIMAIYTFFVVEPKYSSSAQLVAKLPTAEGQNNNINDVNFNLQMINTYKDFIKTPKILEETQVELMKDVNYKGTPEDVGNMITVEQNTNSQLFSIKATSTDPKIAQVTANTMATKFKEQAVDVFEIDKITIVTEARINTTPVSPNVKLNLLIGMVLGLMVGIGFAFLMEVLDKTVKDERYIREVLGLPILGTVPQMTAKELEAKGVTHSTNLQPTTPINNGVNPGSSVNSEQNRSKGRRERTRV